MCNAPHVYEVLLWSPNLYVAGSHTHVRTGQCPRKVRHRRTSGDVGLSTRGIWKICVHQKRGVSNRCVRTQICGALHVEFQVNPRFRHAFYVSHTINLHLWHAMLPMWIMLRGRCLQWMFLKLCWARIVERCLWTCALNSIILVHCLFRIISPHEIRVGTPCVVPSILVPRALFVFRSLQFWSPDIARMHRQYVSLRHIETVSDDSQKSELKFKSWPYV